MKKIAVMLTILCMMISLASCTGSEKIPEHTLLDGDYNVSATDIAVVGDKIYYIADGGVNILSDTEDFVSLSVGSQNAEYLTSDGNALYIYGNGGATRYVEGEKLKQYDLPCDEITSFAVAGDTLIWTASGEIGFYNMKNDDSITQKPLFGTECKALPYDEKTIVIRAYNKTGEMWLYTFNTDSMKAGGFMLSCGNALDTARRQC